MDTHRGRLALPTVSMQVLPPRGAITCANACDNPRRFASGSACFLPVRRFCCGFAAQRFVRILTTSSFTPFAPSKGQPERRRPCCGGKAFGLGASLRLIAKPSLCTDPRRFASGSACLYLYDSFCYGFAAQRFVRLPTTFMLCLLRLNQ